jgi:serine/threonine protein kinase
MWSFGCILVELHTGYPLFPGESEAEQLLCIMEVLGLPPDDVLEKSSRLELFFIGKEPKIIVNSRGKKRIPGYKNLEEIMNTAEDGLVDLVKQCLEWDPEKRITPKSALNHEWLQNQMKLVKNSSSRTNSGQPRQGSTPKHSKRLSVDEVAPPLTTKNAKAQKSFLFM